MKYVLALFLGGVLISVSGYASSEPPADFLNLETCAGYSKYSCTLQEFAKGAFPDNLTRTWEKDGRGNWVLILKGRDAASGQSTRISFVFEKVTNQKGAFANPVRVNSDGEDLPPALIPNVYIPMVEQVGKAGGKTANLPKGPSKEFLSLKVTKPDDASATFRFTVSDLVNYLKGEGYKTSWKEEPPTYVLVLEKQGKKRKLASEKPPSTRPPQLQVPTSTEKGRTHLFIKYRKS